MEQKNHFSLPGRINGIGEFNYIKILAICTYLFKKIILIIYIYFYERKCSVTFMKVNVHIYFYESKCYFYESMYFIYLFTSILFLLEIRCSKLKMFLRNCFNFLRQFLISVHIYFFNGMLCTDYFYLI